MKNINQIQIIGIDHGYGNIKTANAIFPASVQPCAAEPTMAESRLFWAGQWYIIGEGHKEFIADKSTDKDYLLMTMAALAKELKVRGLTEASVHLAVGLPLTWVGEQKASFRRYLTMLSTLEFSFNDVEYTVEILGAEIYAQGFAAVADRLREFTGVNMLCDIGNGTMSIMYINNCRPVGGKCYTEKYGTYQCTLAVREAIMRQLHTTVDDSIIEDVLRTGTADVSERVVNIIRETATAYVDGIMRCLREREFNPELMRLHIMGGGACLVRNFSGVNSERILFIDDIHATAKGYERLAAKRLCGGEAA